MGNKRKKILELLASGKINVDEANELLSAVGEKTLGDEPPAATIARKIRFLRVLVTPNPDYTGPRSGKFGASGQPDKVNIRVPVALIRAGMKFTALIPREASDKVEAALRDKGVNFNLKNLKDSDIEELITALSELEVDVDGGEAKVHIYAE